MRAYATAVAADLPAAVRETALRRVLAFYTGAVNAADRLLNPHRDPMPLALPDADAHPHPDAAAALAWCDAEHANLLAAQQTAARHHWHATVWHLAWGRSGSRAAPTTSAACNSGSATSDRPFRKLPARFPVSGPWPDTLPRPSTRTDGGQGMDGTSGAGRVRVHEPLPNVPSGAEPLFAGFVRELTGLTIVRMGLSGALVLLGVLLVVVEGWGSALPYVYFGTFGGLLLLWTYVLILYRRIRSLFGEPYHRLDVAPDGLRTKGSRVSVRLLDGRWLRTRLSDGPRVQLAGERRLWVLGRGPRVFVRPPGAMWVRSGRIEDAPAAGAVPAEFVPRFPAPPSRDPVLAAHRAFQARRSAVTGVTLLALGAAGLALVSSLEDESGGIADAAGLGGVAGGSAVFLMLGLLTAVGSLRIRRPITEDGWVELRIALDTPFVPRARTAVRLTGWALYPDGRQTRFKLVADISLAANVAVTGQLWLLGYPPAGKPAKAGLPGYPCLGSFRPA
ncbi:hypothetical protein [Amycolatopsis sp. NPDC003861]